MNGTIPSIKPGWLVVGLIAGASLGFGLIRVAGDLGQTRPCLATYARIVAASNAGDLATVRSLCTARYRLGHPIEPAPGGGVAGFPRQVHPNYRVWVERRGLEVRLCPSNRVGLVYRFVPDRGEWRFDGAVGSLGGDGLVTPIDEAPAGVEPDAPGAIP